MTTTMVKILCLTVALVFGFSAQGRKNETPHLQAELVSAVAEVASGQTLLVGVHFKIEPGWHVYWRNPGDSGEMTRVEWILPEGFLPGALLWPAPSRIPVSPLVNFGYEGELTLLAEILAGPQPQAAKSATLRANVAWLVCKETCIPGKTTLSLTLPWTAGKPKLSKHWDKLDAVRASIPASTPQWKASISSDDKNIRLILRGPTEGLKSAEFFPFSETLIQHSANQAPVISPGEIQLEIPRSPFADPGPPKLEDLAGVVVLNGSEKVALEIAPTLSAQREMATAPQILNALLLAFLGGLILNLMPCVFPVLCLKVLSFAQLGGAAKKKAFHHALAYTGGIVVSFWLLVGTLLALRAGGQALGWGFQLQSPLFIAALSFLLVGLSLNLFGVFEMGDSLMGVGQKWAGKEGWAGAFFSGVLATVVATPCTAPFMGTAMGFALAQPAAIAVGVFTFLGLGLAAPYVVFSLFPGMTKRLPRPGAWMVIFKQAMAFPLLLTAWWLMSVLALQSDTGTVFHILLALIFFSVGLWIYGLKTKKRWVQAVLALCFVLGSLAWAWNAVSGAAPASKSEAANGDWAVWSDAAVDEARKTGRPVFVDFTAAWCITCQVNKKVALNVGSVKAHFKEKNVALFEADWTNQDETIARKLESFERNGVPLYVLYPAEGEPRILPQLLTPDIVISAVNQVTSGQNTPDAK